MPDSHGAPVPAVLDDLDARPGSTTSLLRTIIGLYLRPLGGRVSASALVRLAGDAGIPATRARTGITRLKQKGLLLAEAGDYALNPAALPMLERGDRRIFEIRQMSAGDPWCLVSFTVPESRRDLRHQLRRRLQWIGCGAVAPGLWICPDHLAVEVEQILGELDARTFATLFRTEDPRPGTPLTEAVTKWWDLDALRAEHERFQTRLESLDRGTAFHSYVHLIDSWRVLPYVDPGLPSSLLPADWPGMHSFTLFEKLSSRWAGPALSHVRAVTSSVQGAMFTRESAKTG
ncbi:PaaX family transcriptional regulator [Microbacterium keratanolyticum]